MKTTLALITAVALLLIGCQSSTVTPAKSKRAMQAQQYDRIQKESDGSYSVIIKGKVKYSELKYATKMGCATEILMLDKYNKKRIVKAHLFPMFCDDAGDSTVYKYRAVQQGKQTEIYLDIRNKPFEEDRKNIHLASIPKSKADRVFFRNQRNQHTRDNEDGCSNIESIYYQKGDKYGVLGEVTYTWHKSGDTYGFKVGSGRAEYDDLHVIGCLVKVERDGLVGYLGHTDIKYKRIGVFKDTLARFTLPDGRNGWVTQEGKREFYD